MDSVSRITSGNPVVEFLSRLKIVDQAGYTVRDVLVLYCIIRNPGISGVDVAHKIGVEFRSNVNSQITRLIRGKMIEDRREISRKATSQILHPLPDGIAFWESIKP